MSNHMPTRTQTISRANTMTHKRLQPTTNVMTRKHPLWDEFCERLAGEEGCSFTEDMKWKCDGSHDRPFAKAILEDMDMDIVASFTYFDEWGGFCDCEILFNVDRE